MVSDSLALCRNIFWVRTVLGAGITGVDGSDTLRTRPQRCQLRDTERTGFSKTKTTN